MSRLLWAGLGAAGGIYAYRRGTQAWEEAKERGFAGNASVLAATASSMLNHSRNALAEAQAAKDAEISEARIAELVAANARLAQAAPQPTEVTITDPQRPEPSLGRRASARLVQVGRGRVAPQRQRYSA